MIRVLDLILSIVGLLFLSPIILLVFALTLIDTGFPIFCQERLGKEKKVFKLFKFRTMSKNTPSLATHLVSSDVVTPLGRLLRKTKLDELPQLWNVLKGDMSIVGPRPGLCNQIELTAEREKLGVFVDRPGITGLAQISGVDMSNPEFLAQIDARMIAEMSLKSYFKYIGLTVLLVVGMGSGDRIK